MKLDSDTQQDRELPDLREGRNLHCEAVFIMLFRANRDAINETEKVLFHYQNILGKLTLKSEPPS